MTIHKPPPGLLKANQVASLLNISRQRVYQLPIRQIRLATRSYRWDPQDVEDFIQRRIRE